MNMIFVAERKPCETADEMGPGAEESCCSERERERERRLGSVVRRAWAL
jgi:hypothetical protein